MNEHAYSANYLEMSNLDSFCLPDVYQVNNLNRFPSFDFVMSRDNENNVISYYGDSNWDFRPYRLAGNTGAARVNFNFAQESQKAEAKWIVFLLLYIAIGERSYGISIATLMGYLKPIRSMFKYSNLSNITIYQLLSDKDELFRFISTLHTRNLLAGFSSVIGHLASIPESVSGYKTLKISRSEIFRDQLLILKEEQQHPVIPPRILSSLITQLDTLLSDVFKHQRRLWGFLEEVISDNQFARSKAMQRKIGFISKDFKPHFPEAAELFGLSSFFVKYSVSNIPSISSFLTRIQHACRTYLHIYTGMRHAEALSLKTNSLECITGKVGKHYKLHGETSKFIGQKKKVSWVTSKEVLAAYKIADRLAKIIINYAQLDKSTAPLFVSLSYLPLTKAAPKIKREVLVSNSSVKSQEVYPYLDMDMFRIKQSDLTHLQRVDPFRAWNEEADYKVGIVWRFTTHQFRRSLAFYASQSIETSLPSLKRQLKHISRDMTLYYCNSSSLAFEFDHDEHISHLMNKEEVGFKATEYLQQVLNSKEPLYGAHGRYIDKNIKGLNCTILLKENRKLLMEQFKKGELSYKQTPLGACTTTKPCDKKLFRAVAACVSCDRAIIKPSKLEQVITRQEIFIKELSEIDSNSIELRTEKNELEVLLKFKDKVITKEV